ncbi:MAG: hypothetical protein ACOY90_10090 [Candidatus Zhuqueibacterota bacterium]
MKFFDLKLTSESDKNLFTPDRKHEIEPGQVYFGSTEDGIQVEFSFLKKIQKDEQAEYDRNHKMLT